MSKKMIVLIKIGMPDFFVSSVGKGLLFGVITAETHYNETNAYLCECTEFENHGQIINQVVLIPRYQNDNFDLKESDVVTVNCVFSCFGEKISKENVKDFLRSNSKKSWLIGQVEIKPQLPLSIEKKFADIESLQCKKKIRPGDIQDVFNIDDFGVLTVTDKETIKDFVEIPSLINGKVVRKIGDNAFKDCCNIKSIIIPDTVSSIGKSAFEYCINLQDVKLPDSIKTIDNFAFQFCTNVEKINLPNYIVQIGIYAFYYCLNLTKVFLPVELKKIGYAMFESCKNLRTINIPKSVSEIESFAFSSCSLLSDISLPPFLRNINGAAFFGCKSLEKITLPLSLEVLSGSGIFEKCIGLKQLFYEGTKEQWSRIKKSVTPFPVKEKIRWNSGMPATAVHCIDGDVPLDQS